MHSHSKRDKSASGGGRDQHHKGPEEETMPAARRDSHEDGKSNVCRVKAFSHNRRISTMEGLRYLGGKTDVGRASRNEGSHWRYNTKVKIIAGHAVGRAGLT